MPESCAGETRFVILAAPRTGSNWLCSLLNSHPDILCHHEVFNPGGIHYAIGYRNGLIDLGTIEDRDRQPLDFLSRLWSKHFDFPCVGFKMTRGQDDQVLQAVVEDHGVLKILLRRSNSLRTFVSERIAEETGRWEVYDRAELPLRSPRIHVDVDALRAHMAVNHGFYSLLEQALCRSGQSYLPVRYERLSSPDEHARLLTFLGVDPQARMLEAKSVRQNPAALPQLIANYRELESALHGTELESLLHFEEDSLSNGNGVLGVAEPLQ